MFQTILLAAVGLFSIAGALFDWDFFMTSRRATLFVRLLGRQGARVFYLLLGMTIIVMSIVILPEQ